MIALTLATLITAQCNTSKPENTNVAKVEAPHFTLPANTAVVSEVCLNERNLLPAIKQALAAFSKGMGDAPGMNMAFGNINFNDLSECVKGIKALRITQFKFNKPTQPSVSFPGFESQVKDWDRILFVKDPSVAVYCKEDSYLGVMLEPNGGVVIGSEGFIDIAKIAGWAGNFISANNKFSPKINIESIPEPKVEFEVPDIELDINGEAAPESDK